MDIATIPGIVCTYNKPVHTLWYRILEVAWLNEYCKIIGYCVRVYLKISNTYNNQYKHCGQKKHWISHKTEQDIKRRLSTLIYSLLLIMTYHTPTQNYDNADKLLSFCTNVDDVSLLCQEELAKKRNYWLYWLLILPASCC